MIPLTTLYIRYHGISEFFVILLSPTVGVSAANESTPLYYNDGGVEVPLTTQYALGRQ